MKAGILTTLFIAGLAMLTTGCSTTGSNADADTEASELRVTPEGNRLAETNVKLGVGYFQQGNYEYALKKFRKALAIDDNLPSAHYAIALLYDRLGKSKAARQHFERAISLNPQYSDAYNAYAAFLCRGKDYVNADKNFRKALSNPLYRSHQLVKVNAGLCAIRAKNYTGAEGYFRSALQANPRLQTALFHMANIYVETDRHLQARGYIQRFAAVGKHNPQSLLLGVKIERVLGDKNALAKYALLLQKRFPDSNETRELFDSERR